MMSTRIECEYKFVAPAGLTIEQIDDLLAEAALRCRMADSSAHHDVYLDDGLHSLTRHGIGLRLRRSRQGATLCCKDEPGRKGAMFVRNELEMPWSGDQPASAADLPPPLRDLVEPFALRRPLTTLVELEVDRDHRELADGDQSIGELVLDRVVATASGQRAGFTEIEFEVHEDHAACEQFATLLQRRFDLHAAEHDKPRHAVHLLGIPVAAAAETPVDASFRALVAVRAERHLSAIRHAWAAVRSDRGAESVHRLRVALRRLRTLCRAAEDVWPPEDVALVLRTLRDFSRALGPLREADVMLQQVPDWLHGVPGPLLGARETLLQRLADLRAVGRKQAMAVLRSAAHLDAFAALESRIALEAMTGVAADQPADAAAAAEVTRAARQLRRLLDRARPEDDLPDLHELRLSLKRLRYLCEEFATLSDKVLRRLQRAQDRFGAVCDHDAAMRHLLALLDAEPGEAEDRHGHRVYCALLGALSAHEARAERRARKRLGKVLDQMRDKALWRRFDAPSSS